MHRCRWVARVSPNSTFVEFSIWNISHVPVSSSTSRIPNHNLSTLVCRHHYLPSINRLTSVGGRVLTNSITFLCLSSKTPHNMSPAAFSTTCRLVAGLRRSWCETVLTRSPITVIIATWGNDHEHHSARCSSLSGTCPLSSTLLWPAWLSCSLNPSLLSASGSGWRRLVEFLHSAVTIVL